MPLSNKTNSKTYCAELLPCAGDKTTTIFNAIGPTRYGSTPWANHSLGHPEGCREQGANTAQHNR